MLAESCVDCEAEYVCVGVCVVVQQALQNTSDPNIQAKLVAMHRQMARDNPQSIAAEALALLSEKTPRGRPPRDKGALNMTSARSYAKQLQAEYK